MTPRPSFREAFQEVRQKPPWWLNVFALAIGVGVVLVALGVLRRAPEYGRQRDAVEAEATKLKAEQARYKLNPTEFNRKQVEIQQWLYNETKKDFDTRGGK